MSEFIEFRGIILVVFARLQNLFGLSTNFFVYFDTFFLEFIYFDEYNDNAIRIMCEYILY